MQPLLWSAGSLPRRLWPPKGRSGQIGSSGSAYPVLEAAAQVAEAAAQVAEAAAEAAEALQDHGKS